LLYLNQFTESTAVYPKSPEQVIYLLLSLYKLAVIRKTAEIYQSNAEMPLDDGESVS
jgi:hypothetical protein